MFLDKILPLLLMVGIVVGAVDFKSCAPEDSPYDDVQVSGCDAETMTKCPLTRGGDITLNLKFTPKKTEANVTAVVHGVLGFVQVPFQLPGGDNACVDSGLECPLEADKQYTYTATLPVLKKYPKLSVTVQWALKDSDGNSIVCVRIPSKLV